MTVTDDAAKPLRADARRNRDALLVAARETFAEQGVDGSLEEVARRAGVGVGTLYRHFPTREDLVVALLQERFDRLEALARDLLDEDDPFAALRAWLRAILEHARAYHGVAASVKGTIKDHSTPLGRSVRATHEGWDRLLARAQDAGVARRDADPMDVLRLTYGIAWACEKVEDDPAAIDRMLALVLDGLRPVADAG